jgi:hypothetical protein
VLHAMPSYQLIRILLSITNIKRRRLQQQQQIFYMRANAMLPAFAAQHKSQESIVLAACSVCMQKVCVAEKTR